MKVQFTISVPRWIEIVCVCAVLNYRRFRYGEAFRIIPLTKGLRAIVSPEDYDRLSNFNWYMSKARHTIYAQCAVKSNTVSRRQRHISMHREVLGVFDDRFVDHQNHNGLDNRRSNLRIATAAENGWNRKKTSAKCTSQFKGVCWWKKGSKWRTQGTHNGKQVIIGEFENEIDAAKAYDDWAKKTFGQFAALNFPSENKNALGNWSFKICYERFTG